MNHHHPPHHSTSSSPDTTTHHWSSFPAAHSYLAYFITQNAPFPIPPLGRLFPPFPRRLHPSACPSFPAPPPRAIGATKAATRMSPTSSAAPLPYYQDQHKDMTVDKCLSECSSRGYPYAGLEFKYECYCSKHPPKLPKVDDAKCDIPCAGKSDDDRPCGGSAVVSVYNNPAVVEPVSDRPLVCLVMILKDESHTIMDTLNTVKDHIDCWHILDTGSKDGTQAKITDFFASYHSSPLFPGKSIPGRLFRRALPRLRLHSQSHPRTLQRDCQPHLHTHAQRRRACRESTSHA